MNLAKAELKMLVAEQFGKDLFEQMNSAEDRVQQFRGALTAYKQAEDAINAVSQVITQEAKDGKIDIDSGDPMEVAKYAVAKLMSAARAIHDLGENSVSSTIRAEGIVSGLEQAAKQARKMFDEEAGKAAAVRNAIGDGSDTESDEKIVNFGGPGSSRVLGMHPGMPMKAQRQAEDEAVKRVDNGNGTSGAAESAAKPKKAAPKKKRATKRPKKKADAPNT